jgi:proline iminopeptidase
MKKAVIAIASAGLLVAITIAAFGIFASRPPYRPGMVRAQKNLHAPLTPPPQSGDPSFWDMEAVIKLYHFAYGSGRNVLVVHGGPGLPFRMPMTGLLSLNSDYRFNYYDERGSGDSTRPFDRFASPDSTKNLSTLENTLGMGAQIADIERIRRLLGEEKLILIGHSWGGFLSALYASEFPDRVEKLILVSPATLLTASPKGCNYYDTIRQSLPADRRAEYDAFLGEYFDFRSIFKKSDDDLVSLNDRMGQYVIPTLNSASYLPGRSGGWMIWAMYASLGKNHDYRNAIKSITAPTLVMCGAHDFMTQASLRQYSELIPHAEFEVIEGATHFVYDEQPEAFGSAVGKFLKSE